MQPFAPMDATRLSLVHAAGAPGALPYLDNSITVIFDDGIDGIEDDREIWVGDWDRVSDRVRSVTDTYEVRNGTCRLMIHM